MAQPKSCGFNSRPLMGFHFLVFSLMHQTFSIKFLLINPLTTDEFGRMLSVGAIHFENTFCASRRVGQLLVAGALSGWRALTIECSLMSGCGQGHEPTENVSIKL